MQDVVHHTGLAHRSVRDLHWKALLEQGVGRKQRPIRIIYLVGLGIEHVECINLDAPAVVESITETTIEDAGRRRTECAVLGERARAEIAPAQRAEPAGRLAQRNAR